MKTPLQFHPASFGKPLPVPFGFWLQGLKHGLLPLVLLWTMLTAQAQTETFPAGSYIINMGVTPQTEANALRPYGLVYDLLKNNKVPIKWVISQSKGIDGVDFTYNGVQYKGGTFIISAPFRTTAVNNKISSYGVTGTTTTTPLTVDVTHTLTAAPTWTLDADNGKIAEPFFDKADIPSSAYNWKKPAALSSCDDIFVMPHAEPTWSTHGNLYNWNRTQFGAIWAGCKAVSELENMNNGTLQTNFLALNVGAVGNALVPADDHADGTPPYTRQSPNIAGAQYMGFTDLAHTNGAEQVYLPKLGGGWRPTTRIIANDPTQANVPGLSAGPAALIATGRGFGLNTSGWVMYEAGHNILSGKGVPLSSAIPAVRAFFNFSFLSSMDKVPLVSGVSVPTSMVSGTSYPVSVTASSPVGSNLVYSWSSSCGGTFANATAASTTFTPPAVASPTACIITVTVTDACGRTTFISTPITVSCRQSVSTVVTPLCSGTTNTGAIALTVTGGTAPYTYSWTRAEGGSGSGSGVNITGLAAGTYTVTVTSANGCVATVTATVGTFPPLVLSETVTQVLCNAGTTGSINLSVLGGTAPYSYNWGGGITTQNRSGLTAGTYSVTVTDSKGCTASKSIVVTQPTALSATPTATPVNCFGQATGAISLVVSGGVGPYSYAWSNGATTQNVTGLLAGTYSVTVTDANGCVRTVTGISVTQPAAALSLTPSQTNVSCNGGSTGTATVTASGGTAPYSYDWAGTPTGDGTPTITGLAAGAYTVTVTDARGCTAVRTVTITQPLVLTLSETVTQVLCNGGATGSITLTVSGGTAPYSYNWGGGITTQNRTNLTAGTYSVTVTDANGCTVNKSIVVTQPTALSAVPTTTNIDCFGQSTGTITLTVSGGQNPYSYSWSNGATTQNVTGLSAGTYSVTVTDANGCLRTVTGISVTQPAAALSLTSSQTNASCSGGTGTATVTASGGTAPYSYDWAGSPTGDGTPTITGLSPGTYNVTVTDARGCSALLSVTITQPTALALSETVTQILCNGNATGSITLAVSGGTSPYSYNWGGGITTQNRTNLTVGNYSVTVTDANGCTVNKSFTLTQPPALTATSTITNIDCFGQATGTITLTVAGGVAPYSYAWSNGATTQNLTGLVAGTYSVTVTDANGCVRTLTNLQVTQPAAALSLTSSQTNVSCSGGNNGTATVTASGGTGPYSYDWVGTPTGDGTPTITGLAAGTYTVTVTDARGCTAVRTVTITQPSPLALSLAKVDPTCPPPASGDGTLNLTVSGGTSPYSYAWTTVGGSGLNPTAEDQTGLRAGSYTVVVTDANGCTATTSTTLTYTNTNPVQPGPISNN